MVAASLFLAAATTSLQPTSALATPEGPERAHIPASITRYQLMDIDAAALRQKASNNENVQITFAGKTYNLELSPNLLRASDFKATITANGREIDVPQEDVQTYKGSVVGENGSTVRLTMTKAQVSGFVKTADTWFFIEPLSNYDPQADRMKHFGYRTADTDFTLSLSDDVAYPTSGISTGQNNNNALSLGDANQKSATIIEPFSHKYPATLTARLILDCDREFYNISPSTWQSRQLSVINDASANYNSQISRAPPSSRRTGVINDASANYNSQIDIQFSVVRQACDTTNSRLTSTDSDTLLNQLANRWSSDTTTRNLVHLFTGKDISRFGNSNNIGLAFQHGIHTPATYGYGLGQYVSQSGYSASNYQKEILASHEIGHGFAATHAAAVQWCSLKDIFGNCIQWRYSIMWDPFMGDSMTDIFSDGAQDPTKNNESTIRGEGNAHLS